MASTSWQRMIARMTAPAPSHTLGEAEQIVEQQFGIAGKAVLLGGECDQNIRIDAADGTAYVLKVANPLDDERAIEFQCDVLTHLAERDSGLPVPRVVTTTSGGPIATIPSPDGRRSAARLLTFLPGTPVDNGRMGPALRAELGECLARMDRALVDFSLPGDEGELIWNMMHAPQLLQLIDYVPDAHNRRQARRVIDRFAEQVLPSLLSTRAQVIYNDLNPSNILVHADDGERLAGIIDFGDVVRSRLIVDVAVAAAYQVRHTLDPWDAVCQLLAAYNRQLPLEPREIDLLFDLIAMRIASALIITAWHASVHPANRTYILRNADSHADVLGRFEQTSPSAVTRRLRAACGLPTS